MSFGLTNAMTHFMYLMNSGCMPELDKFIVVFINTKVNYFCEDAEGTLWFKDRLVVPKKEVLAKKILDEAHMSR
jgi:hypothetical protein